jgi:hypothetical protein
LSNFQAAANQLRSQIFTELESCGGGCQISSQLGNQIFSQLEKKKIFKFFISSKIEIIFILCYNERGNININISTNFN